MSVSSSNRPLQSPLSLTLTPPNLLIPLAGRYGYIMYLPVRPPWADSPYSQVPSLQSSPPKSQSRDLSWDRLEGQLRGLSTGAGQEPTWPGYPSIFGQIWPQTLSRTTGLVLQFRLHQKSAPQTSSTLAPPCLQRASQHSLISIPYRDYPSPSSAAVYFASDC